MPRLHRMAGLLLLAGMLSSGSADGIPAKPLLEPAPLEVRMFAHGYYFQPTSGKRLATMPGSYISVTATVEDADGTILTYLAVEKVLVVNWNWGCITEDRLELDVGRLLLNANQKAELDLFVYQQAKLRWILEPNDRVEKRLIRSILLVR